MELDHRKPIYLQLKEQLCQQILTGVLACGEQLPSVREQAAARAINPNTIARAYRELESEGWVEAIPGKGIFVCDRQAPGTARRQQLLEKLDLLVEQLEAVGMDRAAVLEHLKGGAPHA